MPTYIIEHRIETLNHNAVFEKTDFPSFRINDIELSHWNFNIQEGWLQDYWLAVEKVKSLNLTEAINLHRRKLSKIVSRVALIGQCYTEYLSQPFLITNEEKNFGYFHYTEETPAVGLMFDQEELQALIELQDNLTIPDEFYFYWNDAVNTYGYASKLLVMFSALDCLCGGQNINKEIKYQNLENILGKELVETLYGTKENSQIGLRHRLIHGEYFKPQDTQTDFLDVVHKKVISYFNNQILKKELINTKVTSPQRHLFGNKEQTANFIKPKNPSHILEIKSVLGDFTEHGVYEPKKFTYVWDEELISKFKGQNV